MGIHISFTDWDGVAKEYSYVGLENFFAIFKDTRVRGPFRNTLEFALLGSVFGNIIPLSLALLVNSKYAKMNTIARVMFFIPVCPY